MSSLALSKLRKKRILLEIEEKAKKKINRFDGLSEEEVQRNTLCDYLEENLDMVFVGINPSLMAAHRGRYYAGPGNHFYKLLHASNLTPRFVSYEEDYKLPRYGIGLTNIVARATRSSADLKRTEIKEGAKIVEEKLKFYKPKIAIFNGEIADVDVKEFWFDGKCKQFIPSTSKMWRRKNMSAFLHGGRIANKYTVDVDTSEDNIAVVRSTEFIVKTLKSESNNSEDDKEYFISQNDETADNKEFSAQMKENNITRSSSSEKNNFHVKSPADVMTGVQNQRTYKKIKRLPPKRISVQNVTGNSDSLNFVKLIKQRLLEKNNNTNVKIIQEEK